VRAKTGLRASWSVRGLAGHRIEGLNRPTAVLGRFLGTRRPDRRWLVRCLGCRYGNHGRDATSPVGDVGDHTADSGVVQNVRELRSELSRGHLTFGHLRSVPRWSMVYTGGHVVGDNREARQA
jgi:hypothetical protein